MLEQLQLYVFEGPGFMQVENAEDFGQLIDQHNTTFADVWKEGT